MMPVGPMASTPGPAMRMPAIPKSPTPGGGGGGGGSSPRGGISNRTAADRWAESCADRFGWNNG